MIDEFRRQTRDGVDELALLGRGGRSRDIGIRQYRGSLRRARTHGIRPAISSSTIRLPRFRRGTRGDQREYGENECEM